MHGINSSEFQQRASSLAHGQTRTRVSVSQLRQATLPLPPLEEQKRIAAILDKADELLAKRRAAVAHLDSLTQAIFLDMFGDPVSNSRGWPMRPFGEVCETRLGKMLDQKRQTGLDQRPYVRNANVRWFELDLRDLAHMDFDSKDRAEFLLQPGDLLICEGGEPGRAAVWAGEMAECYFQKAIHRGRTDLEVAHPEFLMWLLWFLSHNGGLVDHVSTATIAHLTGERLRAMRVPVPPVALQETFVARYQAVRQLKQKMSDAAKGHDETVASLQARAFRGEL
ncbi:MAG: restriction endonuclease subunit S [Actinobacteria bacterium]|nr:restriction endonuclease subunit S [Actinomycetota bacterium]